MGKVKVGVISPYPEFTKIVMQVARDLELDVSVREETPDKTVEIAQDWQKESQVEIIIARGTTAALLKKQLTVPVLMMEITSFDIAEAICRAKPIGRSIALIDFEHQPPRYDYNRIREITGLDFKVFLYRSEEQLCKLLEQLSRQKTDMIVVTGAYVLQKARGNGLSSVLIHSGREFIQDTLKNALYVCRQRRRDLHLCKSIQIILNNAYDGILTVEKDKVTVFNPVAEKITGMRAGDILGKSITEVCRINSACRALYDDGKAVSGQILHLGSLPMIVNRVSVFQGQNNYGVVVTFQAADKIRLMEAKIRRELHDKGLVAKYRFSDIVGHSAMITETIREAMKYARSEAAVLITGESGTGKELFAQGMHNESNQRDGPFVVVNCAALPENLLESELFGYEEGAFTGARKGGKRGMFNLAHGGTIFLDEVGELSPGLQIKLLRVLQEKEIMPVGSQRVIPVDVRVLSATNQDLAKLVDERRFRKDLYFRLNVLNLWVPPLRDRLEDAPELFKHFLERLSAFAMDSLNISNNLLEELKNYMWPGNVRELDGFVERYVALGEENIRTHSTFYGLLKKLTDGVTPSGISANSKILTIELGNMLDMEKQIFTQASRLIRGSKSEMAQVLGISRTTLWKKLKELDIDIPNDEKTN